MTDPWVVWSFEHDGWWRPDSWGYTLDLAVAGRFSEHRAREIEAQANLVTVNEQAMSLQAAATFVPPASFCCPRCHRRCFHPHDVRERYCGACHVFVDDAR